jgi:phage baseplate assembly protein W
MSTTITRNSRSYVDVDFLFSKHPESNNLAVKTNANSIKQSVIHLLTLREGDKPFHPEISSPIFKYWFENFSIVEKFIVEGEIKKYLNRYEPRIEINSITVSSSNPNEMNCTILGTIVNLQQPITINTLIERIR